jgi:hypothetical protein
VRLIPVGLGVVAALQIVAAAAAYPVLTLAISLAGSLIRSATSHEQGALTIFFVAGLPMAFGSLLMAGVFVAVPLGVCVAGAFVLGWLGRRRAAHAAVGQLLAFGSAVVLINVVVLIAGVLLRPVWWYSEKLAGLIPLWPLMVGFALNAVLDSLVAAAMLRSRLRARREVAG